jgi:hypothetical protein
MAVMVAVEAALGDVGDGSGIVGDTGVNVGVGGNGFDVVVGAKVEDLAADVALLVAVVASLGDVGDEAGVVGGTGVKVGEGDDGNGAVCADVGVLAAGMAVMVPFWAM